MVFAADAGALTRYVTGGKAYDQCLLFLFW